MEKSEKRKKDKRKSIKRKNERRSRYQKEKGYNEGKKIEEIKEKTEEKIVKSEGKEKIR